MSEMITIKVSREVHDKLERLGGKGDTFDEIVRRLLAGSLGK